MINTYDIKKQQLEQGAFKVGSGSENILIMGSCRSVPYLNYLNEVNKVDNKHTIYFIDPFNWNWDKKDNRVDYDEVLKTLETNKYLLDLFASTKIFIHEYYKNFGMFNTIEDGDKNIYEFGIKPEVDVCIPNFNDVFIMFNDLYTFDRVINDRVRKEIMRHGKVTNQTILMSYETSKDNIEKFYAVCRMSDVPEMEEYFKENFTKVRLFWTYNHISKDFAMFIFKKINEKFLKLNISETTWNKIESLEDMYANRYTFLTEYDLKFYDYKLNEEIKTFTI
jgi:hypothetical protein